MALSITDREQLKEKLLSKIQRTLAKITRMEDMTQPVSPENSIGRVNRMDAINKKCVGGSPAYGQDGSGCHADSPANPLARASDAAGRSHFQRLALMPGSFKCVHCA